jgi:secreted Zn-dependent insulinase-like peptidase
MYSSSIQKLVVYTNKITKKLLQTIELFSEIEYKPVEKVQLPYPYPKENCQKLWKIVPCKDKNKMLLQWTIPYDGSLYRIKPYYYMVMLLNHEGEKSLQKKLIQVNRFLKIFIIFFK